MFIEDVRAYPLSFAIPPEYQVSLGIGRTVKRDAVLVKVRTDDGIVGWGEAHAARAPTAIAELINTTLRQLVVGMDARDIEAVWQRIYRQQLASHGAGAAAVIGLSGIDMALWDIRGQAESAPLYQLLGGQSQEIDAYAGGISLGFQPLDALIDEVDAVVAKGYRALKLRLGESPQKDINAVRAVRQHLGDAFEFMGDANTAYRLSDVAQLMPVLDECRLAWLEEPFPPHDYRNYIAAKGLGQTPLAAGENHYTRYDFSRVVDDGAITKWQPDLSKTGGISEAIRIAAMADSCGATVHPHTSLTALNMAASVHFLASRASPGYFEADLSAFNPFHDELCRGGFSATTHGTVIPSDAPGLGVAVDESRFDDFAVIPGPGYI